MTTGTDEELKKLKPLKLEEPKPLAYVFNYETNQYQASTPEEVAKREQFYQENPQIGPPGTPGTITPAQYQVQQQKQQDELALLVQRIYPEKFPMEITPDITTNVYREAFSQAQNNTEGFIADLLKRASPQDTEALLRSFGATPELIDQVLTPPVQQNRLIQDVQTIFPEFQNLEEFNNLVQSDFNAFIKRIQIGGLTPEKQDLLQLMGYTPEEIQAAFAPLQQVNPAIDSFVKTVDQWANRTINWNQLDIDKPAFARAMRQAGATPNEIITFPDWQKLNPEQKQTVAGIYEADPYRGNAFSSQIASAAEAAGSNLITGAILSPVVASALPVAKKLTGQDVTPMEWAVGAANLVLLGLGPAGGAISAAGRAGAVAVKATTAAGFGIFTADTVMKWPEMSTSDKVIAVAMNTLFGLGVLHSFKGTSVKASDISKSIDAVVSKVDDASKTEAKASLLDITKGIASKDEALVKQAGERLSTIKGLEEQGKLVSDNARKLTETGKATPEAIANLEKATTENAKLLDEKKISTLDAKMAEVKANLASERGAAKIPGKEPKEPWQMSKSEFVKNKDIRTFPMTREEGHRNIIEKALSGGKPVPPEVLKDYPDLVKNVPKVLKDLRPKLNAYAEKNNLTGIELENYIKQYTKDIFGNDAEVTLYRGVPQAATGSMGKWWTTEYDRAKVYAFGNDLSKNGKVLQVKVKTSDLLNSELSGVESASDGFVLGERLLGKSSISEVPSNMTPKAEPGMPEAGLQTDIFGGTKEVRPQGKGKITQISMDEQLKYAQAQRDAEIEALKDTFANHPARDLIDVIKRSGAMKGEMPNLTLAEYKRLTGTTASQAIRTADGKHVRWEYSLDQLASERGYADGEALREGILEAKKIKDQISALENKAVEPIVPEEFAEVPPSEPPPPQSITPAPAMPPIPKGEALERIIKQSTMQVGQDRPGTLKNLMLKIPGIKQALEFERPGLKMTGENEKVLVAMVAENAARSDISVWATGTRLGLLRDIRKVFGKDALRGGKVEAKFKGTPEQAKNPLTGTLKDIADNPELYELSQEQLNIFDAMELRNNLLLDVVTKDYNAEIGQFKPKPNGAFLPNVDIAEDVIQYLGNESRAASTGRGKTRIWQTARDRMASDKTFKPETDVQKLIEGLDNFKASAAGGQTYRAAIGGLTRLEAMKETHPALYGKMTDLRKRLQSLRGSAGRLDKKLETAIDEFMASSYEGADLATLREGIDVKLQTGKRAGMDIKDIQAQIDAVKAEISDLRPYWESANLKPYVFVQEGVFRYFPGETAKLIKESRQVSNSPIINFVERWRGQAFSGDFSPFSIQGSIGVLADPFGSLKAGAGAVKTAVQKHDLLRSVKIDALADDIAANPNEWSQFASLMGRGLTGTPKEYAAGFMSKLPGFDKFTESTYITVTRGSFNLWQRTYKNMVKHGIPELDAKVAAADLANKVYPLASSARLGQSQARASFLRSLPTSYSFLRQPASLVAQAAEGLGKIAIRQPLTAQESLAVKTVITGAATTLAVSATSAAISAQAKGEDVQKAIWDAINPNPYNGKFASIIIGDKRIPLGGPYRSLFRALYPQEVKGVPYPVPFAGIPNYIKNRITPAISTQLDLLVNKDYSGAQIIKGDFPENIGRALAYEFENFLPLSAGTAVEALRQGDRFRESLPEQIIAQFMGTNLVTLDNTYIDRQIKQLGLPKETEPKPYEVPKPEAYNTNDLWSDVNRVLNSRSKEEGYDDKPITKAIIEARKIKKQTDALPNEKLTKVDFDKLQQRQTLDKEARDVFDKDNPTLAGVSQRDYVLLREYYSLDPAKQEQFLKDHPELEANPRAEWLKAHPKEDAQLAIWGQSKIYTKEAYNQFKKLVVELDIPDGALPELTLPPEKSIDTHFAYEQTVLDGKQGSWETQLLLRKDADAAKKAGVKSYAEWRDLQVSDTPIASLELKVKNRDNFDKLDAFSDDKSSSYIADEKARAEAVAKFKASNPQFVDDMRRIDIIEKGTDENPVDKKIIDAHVKFGQLTDQPDRGSSSAEAMLFRVDNPEYDKFRTDDTVWGDQALKPVDQSKVPIWRIDAKYRKEDGEYEALKTQAERDKYLAKNDAYRKDRRRRDFYGLNEQIVSADEFTQSLSGLKQNMQTHMNYQTDWDRKWSDNYYKAIQVIEKYQAGGSDPAQLQNAISNMSEDIVLVNQAIKDFESKGDTENAQYYEGIDKRSMQILSVLNRLGDTENMTGKYVDYYELPDKGFRQERYLVENPGFAAFLHSAKGMDLPDPTKVPAVQYDDITEKYQDSFDKLDGLANNTSRFYVEDPAARESARANLRFTGGKLNEFGLAEIERAAYAKFIPEPYVKDYVGYYTIIGEGKPKNWQYQTGTDLWFEDDWYMMEHPEFYKNVYLGLLGNERKDYRKVPAPEVFNKYLTYLKQASTTAKKNFRAANPDLDAWGGIAFGWTPITEQKRRSELSPTDRALEDVANQAEEWRQQLSDIDKILAGIR